MAQLHNRRYFIKLTGSGIAGLVGGTAVFAETLEPELVVYNANIYTMDTRFPKAQAFAVGGGRFLAVGSNEEVKPRIGKRTRTFDARGMTIVPGFIDSHVHASGEILLFETLVGNPFEVEHVTIDSIVSKLRERAAKTPPGHWVEGFFFDDTKMKDGQKLDIRHLDQVSADHPVAVRHRGGHTSYFNSKAFALAGITDQTPDPPGGTFDKGPDGRLSGRVTDRAREVFVNFGSRPVFTQEQQQQRGRDGIAYLSKQFARYGLTSVHHQSGDPRVLQQVRARGELLHRVSYEARGEMLDAMIANGLETGFGDEWIRLGATSEHSADGSFSERTMALSFTYPGIEPPYRGNVTRTQEELDAWVEKVHRAGIQPNIHANGDLAINMALSSFERAARLYPRPDIRPKITHCTLINDDLLRRIKALGVVPAAFTTYLFYNSDKFEFYGEDVMRRAMAFRSFVDAGIPVAAGSDFSPGPFSPLMGIQGMVTRKGWNGKIWGANQRITVAEALKISTWNGAYASREESIKGSITPAKLADFVVLAEDPHRIDPERIKDIKIVQTVTGGSVVYQD